MVFCIYEIAKVRYFHTINMVYFRLIITVHSKNFTGWYILLISLPSQDA